jgi:hypothetical protein
MKSYRNYKEVKRKETMGRRLSMGGLAILFIGLMASFVPSWLPPDQPATTPIQQFLQQYWTWISFAALPIGFILASLGSYNINRYARRRWPGSRTLARPDEVFERSMKGFDNKYAYFVWSLPASHVVVGPCGILLFALRGDRGRVTVRGDKWREPFSIGRIFTLFAREGVGNPAAELEDQRQSLRKLLSNTQSAETDQPPASADLANVPIEGAAVFLNQQIQLDVDNPTIPALRADQVKDYVRRTAKDVKLNSKTVRELTEFLVGHSTFQDEDDV